MSEREDVLERYRLYVQRDGELHYLASAPDAGGIGQAIITNHKDCKEAGLRFDDLGVIGIRDALEREWIVTPFPRGAAT